MSNRQYIDEVERNNTEDLRNRTINGHVGELHADALKAITEYQSYVLEHLMPYSRKL